VVEDAPQLVEAMNLYDNDKKGFSEDDMEVPAEFLTFTVVGARGFRNSDWLPGLGKPDCYVVVTSWVPGTGSKELCMTNVIQDSMEPRWNFEFVDETWKEGGELEFRLYDKDLIGSDFLGKVTIRGDSFQDGFNGEVQLEEADKDGTDENRAAFLHLKIKPPGKVYPPGSPAEFEVNLTKSVAEPYGLTIDTQDLKTLFVTGIEEGAAAAYNQQAQPEHRIVQGDFIVEINGVAGHPGNMLRKLKEDDSMVAKVRHAIDMTLVLERNDDLQPLGITWPEPLKGKNLVVLEINEGLFADWNASQPEDATSKIQVGDRIMRVGATSGSALDLAKAIQEVKGKFQVALLRAPKLFQEESEKQDPQTYSIEISD